MLSFLNLLVDPASGALHVDRTDEIVSATLVCAEGALAHKQEATTA
jgi:hypothetical protein